LSTPTISPRTEIDLGDCGGPAQPAFPRRRTYRVTAVITDTATESADDANPACAVTHRSER
ncbi:hypothetical protein, partial [Gordonia malaquae]|uniref:hypothetical protein n=1 Tax=Gordonia malaquae TaxID=410332 RepID=UPI00058E3760